MLEEFKKFIFKGDVVALSTGVLIGAAFGKIVDGFTKGIVEPILKLFGGGPEVSGLSFAIGKFKEVVKNPDGTPMKGPDGKEITKLVDNIMDPGLIVNSLIGFLITAAIIFFLIVKPLSKMSAKLAAAPAPPPDDVKLLTEIRDLLKK